MSAKEREEHERTHLPYRSWCDICVKARGRRLAHRSNSQRGDKGIGVPHISINNFYLNDQLEGTNPLLIVMEECTGEKCVRQVERTGVGDDVAMDWLKDISEELISWWHQRGSESRLVFNTDGEFALTSLRDAVGRFHGGVITPELSARGESQPNGSAERPVQVVAEFGRVLKQPIESKTGAKLPPSDNITPWMVRWAAIHCSKYMVGSDGLIPHERRRGKRCRERVLYKRIREGKQWIDKFESEDDEGAWLGHSRSSNEVLTGTRDRVVRAQSFRRRDHGARCNIDLIKGMRGTPNQPDPLHPGRRIPIRVHFDDRIIVDDASCAPAQGSGSCTTFWRSMVKQMVVLDVDTRDPASLDQGITLNHAVTGSTVKH